MPCWKLMSFQGDTLLSPKSGLSNRNAASLCEIPGRPETELRDQANCYNHNVSLSPDGERCQQACIAKTQCCSTFCCMSRVMTWSLKSGPTCVTVSAEYTCSEHLQQPCCYEGNREKMMDEKKFFFVRLKYSIRDTAVLGSFTYKHNVCFFNFLTSKCVSTDGLGMTRHSDVHKLDR